MDNTIRQIGMRKATATAAMLALSLTACSPAGSPAPISDVQAKLIVEQCAAKGYATRISNSFAVSRIECDGASR